MISKFGLTREEKELAKLDKLYNKYLTDIKSCDELVNDISTAFEKWSAILRGLRLVLIEGKAENGDSEPGRQPSIYVYVLPAHSRPVLPTFTPLTLEMTTKMWNAYQNSTGSSFWDDLPKIDAEMRRAYCILAGSSTTPGDTDWTFIDRLDGKPYIEERNRLLKSYRDKYGNAEPTLATGADSAINGMIAVSEPFQIGDFFRLSC